MAFHLNVEKLYDRALSIENYADKQGHRRFRLPPASELFSRTGWTSQTLESFKKRLNETKSRLDEIDLSVWKPHTRNTNPTGDVIRFLRKQIGPEMCTTAWAKMYEMLAYHRRDIFGRYFIDGSMMKSMNSVHVCEAPGGFIAAFNHFLHVEYPRLAANWTWTGLTLNPDYEGHDPKYMINDNKFILATLNNWCFGEDDTGDIMELRNLMNLRAVSHAKGGKVMFFSGDGSIDCMDQPEDQELITAHLHYCEAISALTILEVGGSAIIKMFTLFEHPSVCLLYLLTCVFEKITVHKPATSRSGNSETYAVCVGYLGCDADILRVLHEHYTIPVPNMKPNGELVTDPIEFRMETHGQSSLFRRSHLPDVFVEWVYDTAEFFETQQRKQIQYNLDTFMNNPRDEQDAVRRFRIRVGNEFFKFTNVKPISRSERICKFVDMQEGGQREKIDPFSGSQNNDEKSTGHGKGVKRSLDPDATNTQAERSARLSRFSFQLAKRLRAFTDRQAAVGNSKNLRLQKLFSSAGFGGQTGSDAENPKAETADVRSTEDSFEAELAARSSRTESSLKSDRLGLGVSDLDAASVGATIKSFVLTVPIAQRSFANPTPGWNTLSVSAQPEALSIRAISGLQYSGVRNSPFVGDDSYTMNVLKARMESSSLRLLQSCTSWLQARSVAEIFKGSILSEYFAASSENIEILEPTWQSVGSHIDLMGLLSDSDCRVLFMSDKMSSVLLDFLTKLRPSQAPFASAILPRSAIFNLTDIAREHDLRSSSFSLVVAGDLQYFPPSELLPRDKSALERVLLSLFVLKKNGSLVIRMHDFLSRFTAGLLFLLSSLFKTMHFETDYYVPSIPDRLVVCSGYVGCPVDSISEYASHPVVAVLTQVVHGFDDASTVVPLSFVDMMSVRNSSVLRQLFFNLKKLNDILLHREFEALVDLELFCESAAIEGSAMYRQELMDKWKC
eukprot:ANDGO_02632.mRNA.1 Cap-specific mRNA (nucleoside-2'-O-)-methyltransferase 2